MAESTVIQEGRYFYAIINGERCGAFESSHDAWRFIDYHQNPEKQTDLRVDWLWRQKRDQ